MAALTGFLALGNIDPTTGAFTELTAAGYARQPVVFELDTPSNGGAVGTGGVVVRNSVDVTFPVLTAPDWPSVNAFAVFASSTGGVPLFHTGFGWRSGVHQRGTARTVRAGSLKLSLENGRLVSVLGGVVTTSGAPNLVSGSLLIGNDPGAVVAALARPVYLATMGDSRTEVGTIPTAYTTSATVSKSARGLPFWIEALTGGWATCPSALNFGVGGETSTQILARVPTAIATAKTYGASLVILFGCSTNDRTSGLSYADTVANLAAIEAAWVAAGIIVLWVAETPRGLTSDTSKALTGTQIENHVRVEQWQADRRGRPGVFVARPWATVADLSTAATTAAGYALAAAFQDGLHQAPYGAQLIVSPHILPILATLFPAGASPLIQSAADLWSATNPGGNILDNPFLLGSGGTAGTGITGPVANGWTAQYTASTGGTVTAQATLLPGGGQRLEITGTAGSGYEHIRVRRNVAVGARGVAVGVLFKGSMRFVVQPGQQGLAGVAFYEAGNNIDFVASGQPSSSTGSNPDQYPVEGIDGAAVGEGGALPAGSADIAAGARILFRAGATVKATVDIMQVSARAA